MDLSLVENAVVHALERAGMTFEGACIATIMVNRNISTILDQLVDEVITGYPGLEDVPRVRQALDNLVAQGWLETLNVNGVIYCRSAADLYSRIEDRAGHDAVQKLATLRATQGANLTVFGVIYEQETVDAIHEAIRRAQREIRLPLLATPTTIEIARDLESRARKGVQLRLLVASPEVVVALRGESQLKRAEQSVAGWTQVARSWPNTQVRVATAVPDVVMAASASFDREQLLLAVFDPRRQRSHQGTVLAVGQAGYVPNLVTLFDRYFEEAWARGRPTDGFARVWWTISRFGWEIAFALSLAVAFAYLSSSPVVGNLAIGIAGTTLITLFVKYRTAAASAYRRIRRQTI